MASFDLLAMAMRATPGRRKRVVTLRDIPPPTTLASNLFASSYKPVLATINRYADLLNAEYARTLSTIQTDSADDLTSILGRMADELSRLYLLLTPSLRHWAVQVERYQRGKWRGAVLAASAVDIDTLIGPEDVAQTLGDVINWNTALVRDVGDQARGKMASAVFAGLRARSPARDVAAQIREATGFARDRSMRIASDQLSKAMGSLAEERQRQAGISTVEWKSSHKLHARPWHAARDGKVYDLDTHKAIDGSETVEPGDWVSQPPYCGCRSLARITFE